MCKGKKFRRHRELCGEGNGTPPQYSCLENPMDGGAWKAAVHGVAEGRTWLSNFTFTFHFHALEKEMATHSSVLAWRIPGTGESGGLPSTGSHRVGHDWSDLAAAADLRISVVYNRNVWGVVLCKEAGEDTVSSWVLFASHSIPRGKWFEDRRLGFPVSE